MDITKRGPRPPTPHPIIPRDRVQLESSKVTITSSVTGVHEDRGASPRLGPTGFPRVRLPSSLAGTWVVGNATGFKSTSVRKRSRTPPKCIQFGMHLKPILHPNWIPFGTIWASLRRHLGHILATPEPHLAPFAPNFDPIWHMSASLVPHSAYLSSVRAPAA